jgi:tRNA-Thr(GGU) m(6)t(6)A37 methyltransferase TsaA
VVHSPLKEQNDSPIQPKYGQGIEGSVEVYSEYAEGLRDVDGYERIWLLTWLHRSGPARLVVVPYRDTVERGLFATRAPSRPNPIGLHCVRVRKVEGNTIHITELDILDGTPVLDIKPYSPGIDSYPDVKAGWWDKAENARDKADDRFEG